LFELRRGREREGLDEEKAADGCRDLSRVFEPRV